MEYGDAKLGGHGQGKVCFYRDECSCNPSKLVVAWFGVVGVGLQHSGALCTLNGKEPPRYHHWVYKVCLWQSLSPRRGGPKHGNHSCYSGKVVTIQTDDETPLLRPPEVVGSNPTRSLHEEKSPRRLFVVSHLPNCSRELGHELLHFLLKN